MDCRERGRPAPGTATRAASGRTRSWEENSAQASLRVRTLSPLYAYSKLALSRLLDLSLDARGSSRGCSLSAIARQTSEEERLGRGRWGPEPGVLWSPRWDLE